MKRIAVVGAGLSGRLLALNLLRFASHKTAMSIRLFDRGDESYMGPAYTNDDDYMLLNVPAGRMGAYSEDQGHFLKWCRNNSIMAEEHDFLPRRLYRDYIMSLMRDALQGSSNEVTVDHVCGDVTDIDVLDNGITLYVSGRRPFYANKIVLAMGNYPPRQLPVANSSAYESKRYIDNPWKRGVFDTLDPHDTVFLIGTGQTMVDLAITFHRRLHKGRIVALSRRGFLPLAHVTWNPTSLSSRRLNHLGRFSISSRRYASILTWQSRWE